MNNKGQAGIAIVIAMMIFIVGMSAINLLKPEITTLRTVTGLNCVNASAISDGTKMTCLAVGATIPLVIIAVFSVAGGIIFNKFVKARKK
jgi:hypothetical protein